MTPELQKRIEIFLTQWHEAGRESFERLYKNLDYDSPSYCKSAKERSKYVALDSGTSGAFLLDKETGEVFQIKGYGVPDRRKRVCNIWDATIDGGILYQRRRY